MSAADSWICTHGFLRGEPLVSQCPESGSTWISWHCALGSSALPPCANTVSFVCRLFCDPAGLMRLRNPWSVSSKAFQRHFPAQPFEVSRRRCPGARSHKHFPGGKPAGVSNPSATRSCGRGHTAAMPRAGSARRGDRKSVV